MRELTFLEDLILALTRSVVTDEAAQKAVRALCRHYGGQMVSIPAKKAEGKTGSAIHEIIAGATDGAVADAALEKLMALYGGCQVYIPFERNGFRKVIALEIFNRHVKGGEAMNDLAREYGISFTHAYRLWREGQRETVKKTLPYQPFLDF
jgi:Mor family transcriptional regulator